MSSLTRRQRRLLFWGLVGLGAALRFAALGSFPPGLNQDEASAGYEAWSLLHYGIDRNGYRLPVLLVAWGSGQNALYSYLAIPFIALFGLSPFSLRLPAALCGTLSLPLFYAAARRVRGEHFALWALFALAINPWHILLSRWALESNLLPFCLLAGFSFLLKSEEKGWYLPLAAAFLALSLYAYGTAFLFLILFLPAACILLQPGRRVRWQQFFAALAVFILLALPISLCQLRNALGMEAGHFLGLSLPALNETRQSATMFTGFNGILQFLQLLWTQNDGLIWNYAGLYGLFYGKPGLLLALAGLGSALYELYRHRLPRQELYLLLWLAVSLAAAFFMDVNINRMNMAFLPVIWLQGRALALVGRRAAAVLAAVLLLSATLFTDYYYSGYAENVGRSFYAGLGSAIEYAAAESGADDVLFVSYDVNMPYIYVLFYEEIPPEEYRADVTFMNPGGAFEWVSSVGRWRFGREVPEEAVLAILPAEKAFGLPVEAQFGYWAVVNTDENNEKGALS